MKNIFCHKWDVSNFFRIIFFVMAIVIVLSVILYRLYTGVMVDMIYQNELEDLEVIQNDYDNITHFMAEAAYQLSNDELVIKLLYTPESCTQSELNTLSKILERQVLSLPCIESIYLLSNQGYSVYFSAATFSRAIWFKNEDLADQNIFNIIKNFSEYRYNMPIIRSTDAMSPSSDKYTDECLISYIYSSQPLSVKSLSNAIVINVSPKLLGDRLNRLNPSFTTLIIEGNLTVSSSNPENFVPMQDVSEKIDLEAINSGEEKGYYLDNFFGVKTICVYKKSLQTNRIFFKAIPYSNILDRISNLTSSIVFVCLFGLIISMILATVLSIKVNQPIRKLYRQYESLTQKKNIDKNLLKSLYLKQVLLNNIFGVDEQILKDENIHFEVNVSDNCWIVIFVIETVKENLEEISASAIPLIINNRFSQFKLETCVISHERYVALLQSKPDCKLDLSILKNLCREVQKEISGYLSIEVVTAIREVRAGLGTLAEQYKSSEDMLKYRISLNCGTIITDEDIEGVKPLNYRMFYQKKQEFKEGLKNLQIEKSHKIYNEIIDIIRNTRYEEFNACIIDLAFEFTAVLEHYKKIPNYNFPDIKYNQFALKIGSANTIEQINQSFEYLFSCLNSIKPIEEHQNFKRVQEIKAYIDDCYGNHDLSVNSLANYFRLSPSYLGKIFLLYTQTPLVKYISILRIEKSMSLLTNTDLPINQIAEIVGFSSVKYFYKIFKEITGTTPNAMRHLVKKEDTCNKQQKKHIEKVSTLFNEMDVHYEQM